MDGRGLSLRLKGVRRGCPLLHCPFVPCVEVVAIAICGENEMKGISVGKVESKLSQYSEDTTMTLDSSQAPLERYFASLDSFGQLSGLRVNCEKTEVLWIGSKKGCALEKKSLKWTDGKVKALGVWFCTDQTEGMKMNHEDKVHKVEDIVI